MKSKTSSLFVICALFVSVLIAVPSQVVFAQETDENGFSLRCFFDPILFWLDTPTECIETSVETEPAPAVTNTNTETIVREIVKEVPVYTNTNTTTPTQTIVRETVVGNGVTNSQLQASLLGLKREILAMIPSRSVTYLPGPSAPTYYVNPGLASIDYVNQRVGEISLAMAQHESATSSLWSTNGSALYYDGGQNVGIGTTTPTKAFVVQGDASFVGSTSFSGAVGIGGGSYALSFTGGSIYPTLLRNTVSGGLLLNNMGTVANANSMLSIRNNNSGADLLTFTGNGNLGIGSTTPSAKLTVVGDVRIDDSAARGLKLMRGGVAIGDVGTGNFHLSFQDRVGDGMEFFGSTTAATAPFMRILGNGNIGMGTTTPEQRLVVAGSARVIGALYDSSNASGTPGMILSSTGTTTEWMATSSLGLISSQWVTSGTAISYSAGNVGIGTTTPEARLSVMSGGTGTGVLAQFTNGAGTPRMTLLDNGGLTVAGTVAVGSAGGQAIYMRSNGLSLSFNRHPSTGVMSNPSAYGYSWTHNPTGVAGTDYLGLSAWTPGAAQVTGANFVLNSNGNVGIGTTTPESKLTVLGDISALGGTLNTDKGIVIHNVFAGYSSSTNGHTIFGQGAGAAQATSSFTLRPNVAIGINALASSTGQNNVAVGYRAMERSQIANGNSALGHYVLINNLMGANNAIVGYQAFLNHASSTDNVALGMRAGMGAASASSSANVFIGSRSGQGNSTGSYNVFLGYQTGDSLTTASNNILIGNDIDLPNVSDSNKLSIGNLIFGTGVDGSGTTLSTGNVGIGTSTPSDKLEVVGSLRVGTSTNPSLYVSSGGVSIGTTTINSGLLITGENSSGLSATIQNFSDVGNGSPVLRMSRARGSAAAPTPVILNSRLGSVEIRGYDGSGFVAAAAITSFASETFSSTSTGTTLRFETTANGSDTRLERMRVNHDGNIGIGTTTPYATLAVTGQSNNTLPNFVIASSTNAVQFTVLANGNVGIGTSSPSRRLHVYDGSGTGAVAAIIEHTVSSGGNQDGTPLTIKRTYPNGNMVDGFGAKISYSIRDDAGVDNTLGALGFVRNGADNTGRFMVYIRNAGVETTPFMVNADGNVGIGTTTPNTGLVVATGTIQATNLYGGATTLSVDANGNIIRTPSDAKLKKDVTTITGALDKVSRLHGVSYSWIDQERFGKDKEIGFIAQELELIVPEVVKSGGEYKSVNYQNMVALLVEAIKELKVKVDGMAVWFKSEKTLDVAQDATLNVNGKTQINGQFCVEEVCVDKNRLKEILVNYGANVQTSYSSNPAPTPAPTGTTTPSEPTDNGTSSEPVVTPTPEPEPEPQPTPAPVVETDNSAPETPADTQE